MLYVGGEGEVAVDPDEVHPGLNVRISISHIQIVRVRWYGLRVLDRCHLCLWLGFERASSFLFFAVSASTAKSRVQLWEAGVCV